MLELTTALLSIKNCRKGNKKYSRFLNNKITMIQQLAYNEFKNVSDFYYYDNLGIKS